MNWFRWHHGTVNDPKWRVVATKSGQPVALVVAVWAAMLEVASQANPRGTLEGWNVEDVAAGLDISSSVVDDICNAMSGKVVDNSRQTSRLIAWDRRQPTKEDPTVNERVQRHREKKRKVTQGNDRGEEIREEKTGKEGTREGEAPAAPTLTLGEFGRCVLTHEEFHKLEQRLGVHLPDFIEQFDRWVDEAPNAKASGVRRRDRHAYKSILNWFDRATKEGRIGKGKQHYDRQSRTDSAVDRVVRKVAQASGSGIPD